MPDAIAPGDQTTVHLIVHETDLLTVRSALRQAAKSAGLRLVPETKLITAGSELARNILRYTTGGRVDVAEVQEGERTGVRAEFSDDGPGIPDLGAAMTDGFTTSGSLGLGLPGARRLVDEFDIRSSPAGTVITITVWTR
jgi:serine/threonine-protein kinase RsbT